MPKVAKSTFHQCNTCNKEFGSLRAITLHEYHNPACRSNDHHHQATVATAFFEVQPTMPLSTHDLFEEETETGMVQNDDSDDEKQHSALPFELTSETLKSLPGEAKVVTHCVEQHCQVELLRILEKAEAPDYLFKEITEWASQSQAKMYNFRPQNTTKKAVINDLQQHLNMKHLRPTITELKLESILPKVPIVSFGFVNTLVTLLTNQTLMQPQNLVINKAIYHDDGTTILDASPWFEPYESSGRGIDEVLSGRWYKDTVDSMVGENIFVCPLIFYIDKTFIDPIKSRFNLEPLTFTLAIFNRECRHQFDFWGTLGHIPEPPEPDELNPAGGCKSRNYHSMLKFLLKDVLALQQNPIQFDNFQLRIGNFVKIVNMRFPVAFIISDTQGADKLCGRYLNYTDKVQRMHRSCLCKPLDATKTTPKCVWVDMDDMMNVIDRADKLELKEYSQQFLPDHAFRNIDFGSNRHGVFGATPNDVLHGIKLGLINYVLEIFFNIETSKASHFHFEQAWKETNVHLRQSGASQYPRLYFPNGITSLTTTTADECHGILFATYILCCTTQGKMAITTKENISILRLKVFINAFEKLLVFHAWLAYKSEYWSLDDIRSQKRATKAVEVFMTFLCDNLTRESSQGWNISKMHELLHITTLIEKFGSPMNFDSGPCERMHKDVAKKPGRQSQKCHATFTLQAANRLADRHVIDVAYHKLVGIDEQQSLQVSIPSSHGSSFNLHISVADETSNYTVVAHGCGALSKQDLSKNLYPNLIEFIVIYFSEFGMMPTVINCCTEYVDTTGTRFRAHHDFRSGGFWHDWAMASYHDDSEEGFSNVPVKILCFLPEGIPGNSEWHAVCHPCQWNKKKESDLITKWTLVACSPVVNNNIPYDVVPVTALMKHCLVIPDTKEAGVIYEVLCKELWHEKFV